MTVTCDNEYMTRNISNALRAHQWEGGVDLVDEDKNLETEKRTGGCVITVLGDDNYKYRFAVCHILIDIQRNKEN